jgi:ribonuclease HII
MDTLLSNTPEPNDNFQFERLLSGRGFSRIAGTDEVGRGPLAGPVVAACVILPKTCDHTVFLDSKKTTEKQRYRLHAMLIAAGAPIGIGVIPPGTIDRINILQASLLAMKESVEQLAAAGDLPDFILVDGTCNVPVNISQEALIKGDNRSASIAAASIVAKITRDEIMADLHTIYPEYNFRSNKGYPTQEHRNAIIRHGPCPEHRRSFRGVKEFVKTAN